MLCAPPITLNNRYHCAPSAMSSMLPQLRLTPSLMKTEGGKGEKKVSRKRSEDLHEGLGNASELRTESDGHANGCPNESTEDQEGHDAACRQETE